ncbi:MAG: tetratricopeptide repeat protein [Chlamydiae bacterium]|nr:tetratricopeptide repeat protein [Chlamydiota bacterium]
MRICKSIINSLLLFTIPSAPLYPQTENPQVEESPTEKFPFSDRLFSYDDVLKLLDEIESGEAEEKYTPEELERITQFIVFLAREGLLPGEDAQELEKDIMDLLYGENDEENEFFYSFNYRYDHAIIPIVFKVIPCRGWLKKKLDKVKRFVKEHKKAIIIGTAIVVATAVVIGVAVAATAGAAAVGTAGAASSPDHDKKGKTKPEEKTSVPLPLVATNNMQEAPMLKSLLDYETSTFKENLVSEQFFQPNQLSLQENGRALGSLFAHDAFTDLKNYITEYPPLSQEIQNIGLQNRYSMPTGNGHQEIDRKFSTDYAHQFDPNKETNFNALSYQLRGEKALEFGYFNQAVNDLGKAIELNPTNPISYLQRGVANFGLGQYDQAIKDYHNYISQIPPITYSFNTSEFVIGVIKGFPNACAKHSKGFLLSLSDLVTHPIHTIEKICQALTILTELALTEQWGALGEAISPEVHHLITKWNTFPSSERGDLAINAFVKLGIDIFIPAKIPKLLSQGIKGAKELATAYKTLQTAEQTLLLEAAAELGSGAKVAEVIQAKAITRAEELGFSASEIGQLRKIGKLEEITGLSIQTGEVVQLEKRISGWLGEGTKLIRNEAGDPIFISKDGLKRIRFDFNNSHGDKVHLHIEQKLNGRWQDASSQHRIYPTDG